jgi:hypothetical protein
MKAKDKIKYFLEAQEKALRGENWYKKETYFNKNMQNRLFKNKEIDFKNCWKELKENIIKDKYFGFIAPTIVHCIIHKDLCTNCFLYKKDNYNPCCLGVMARSRFGELNDLFTKDFYVELINDIEKRARAIKNLRAFMQAKELKLQRLTQYKKGTYYDKEVKKALNNLEDPVQVWNRLKHYIYNHEAYGFKAFTCPFCIATNDDCTKCEYGEIKGYCNEILSSFKIIINRYCLSLVSIFSNEFYKKLIRNIETEGVCS